MASADVLYCFRCEVALTVDPAEPCQGCGYVNDADAFVPGFYEDVPETAYHSGTFGPPEGSLSVTGAKVLLKAPALYRWRQDNPVHSDTFDLGHAAHKLVLGAGAPIEVIDAPDWRTKDAREARQKARVAGRIPLLIADHDRVLAMADALTRHRLAARLLDGARPEVSAYAFDEETGAWWRGRFDSLGERVLTDYKSSASCDPRDLAGRYGSMRKWGYDDQAAWYTDLAADLGHPAEAFAFIFQMKEPPYLVTVARIPDDALWDARQRRRLALQRFRDCTQARRWDHGYIADDTCAVLSLTDQTYTEEVIPV